AGSTLTSTGAADAGVIYGGTFDNRGTFSKQGAGTTTFTNQPTLVNSGTIDVSGGTLELDGPIVQSGLLYSRSAATGWLRGSTGTPTGEPRADGNLYFGGGNHQLNAGTPLTGGRGPSVAGGVVTINAPLTAERFAMSALGGSLQGPQPLTVTTYFQF